jgi:two-component system chemotaxis response regulator CheY
MPLSATTPILVVDDEPMMVDIMTSILHRLGYMDTDHAPDGVTAFTMMWNKAYGLIISDLNMEPMSGLELLRAVRADRVLKEMPFLMTTASMNTKNVFDAKVAGVDGYLLKPFSPNVLAEKLAAMRAAPLPDVLKRDLREHMDGPPDELKVRMPKGAKR